MIELETERLALRPMGPGDVQSHIEMMQVPAVAQYLTVEGKPRDEGTEWRMAAAMVGHWSIRGFGFFSVFEKSTGEWVGRVGPWQPAGWPGLELGWAIAAHHWGKGYAPEAAIATMGWVFETSPNLGRIISLIDGENKNSQKVASKIGETMTDEVYDYFGHTLKVWTIPREAWQKSA